MVADILYLCKPGKNRTAIMYQANLSHQMLKFYMWHMLELGLLERQEPKFRTTEKGAAFLAHYQKLAEVLARLGKMNDVVIPGNAEGAGHLLRRQYHRDRS